MVDEVAEGALQLQGLGGEGAGELDGARPELSRLISLAGLLFSPVAEDGHFEGLVPVSLDHEDHHKDQDAKANEKRDWGEDKRQEMDNGGHQHGKDGPADPENDDSHMNSQRLPGMKPDKTVLLVRVEDETEQDRANQTYET